MLKYWCLSFCVILSSFGADIVDPVTGAKFPEVVTFTYGDQSYTLAATGVSTRKKFTIKIYSIASYLQPNGERGDTLDLIMSDETVKQLTLKWQRPVDFQKVKDGYFESFKKAAHRERYSRIERDISQFMDFFSKGVKDGDVHELRWLPGGTIDVLINGKSVGVIQNPEFAHALWSIWFGKSSVVDRDQLLEKIRR